MKNVVTFTVKATFNTDDAKGAKTAIKSIKEKLAGVNAVNAEGLPIDTKMVVKQIQA